jgi:hypothetical protein
MTPCLLDQKWKRGSNVGAITSRLKCSHEHTGNSDENAKNNSHYAQAAGSSDIDQPLRSRLIELKRNAGRDFLLNQNRISLLILEN